MKRPFDDLIRLDGPIITTPLGIDFYKFTMGRAVIERHPEVPVTYRLVNRTTDVRLADIIDEAELRCQLNHARQLHFNNSELHYIRGTNEYGERMFPPGYLYFLENQYRLPDYSLSVQDGQFDLTFSGPWVQTIYWETIALSIINELYYRALMRELTPFQRESIIANGVHRLQQKVRVLKQRPDITVVEFGTRRRFSRAWQRYINQVLAEELDSQFRGTSETSIAMELGLLPMGTYAHEMDMVYSGIFHDSDDAIRSSHRRVLYDWWDTYGEGLSIALPDTYGSDFFLQDFPREMAHNWKGMRHDSGDPIAFGEKVIKFYESHGIDPRSKMIIFSDGLTLPVILMIADHFRGRIKYSFGWGTNLTNDLGFKALSLVVKVVEANGHGTVKLSDNRAKAIGKSEDIERFSRIFGYTATLNEKCTY
ncbi:MAG: nicotinate phosphoribosyltransferase [Candidatus Komeilibacteria bacterium]